MYTVQYAQCTVLVVMGHSMVNGQLSTECTGSYQSHRFNLLNPNTHLFLALNYWIQFVVESEGLLL